VIDTDDFKSFQANSWAVFMGQYDTKAAAKKAATLYKGKGFSGTPTRLVPTKKATPGE
jgi:hypothetical protein